MLLGWIECIECVMTRCRNKAEFPEVNVFSTLGNSPLQKDNDSQGYKMEQVRNILAEHRIYV